MKYSSRLASVIVGVLLHSGVWAQGLKLPTLNPSEPIVLGKGSTAIKERIDTRKWRKRYNEYELAILIWQIYRVTKEEKDFKEIFGRLTGLLGDEKRQHEAYYAGIRSANSMASGYHVIRDIRGDFAAIIRYGKGIAWVLDDQETWGDVASREYITKISLEIKSRALRTLRYLPVVAGLSDESLPEISENGAQTIVGEYVATTAHRLSHMDRMHTEIRQLKGAMQELYYHVSSIRQGRQEQHQNQRAGQLLLGTK